MWPFILKSKPVGQLTVSKLLKMSYEEIASLNIQYYKPVDIVCMLLREIKQLRRKNGKYSSKQNFKHYC